MNRARVYVCDAVRQVRQMYAGLYPPGWTGRTVREQLELEAERLRETHAREGTAAAVILSNWLPRLLGRTDHAILEDLVAREEFRLAVAREHGFYDWDDVRVLGEVRFDASFETAVDAVVDGDLARLDDILDQRPELIARRSPFAHRARLLHYVGANGVETRRQRVPLNAGAVVDLLLERGADVHATAIMYGGPHTVRRLVGTSAHPSAAGVAGEICRKLDAAERRNAVGRRHARA